MALSGELEFELEIKSPGKDILEIYGSKKEYLPKICSHFIPRIDLLEGDWGQVGCLLMAYYSFEGNEMISKELVEAVGEKNKSITFKFLEGDLMKLYKTLRVTFQVISKNDEAEFLKTTIEYEKLKEDVPKPDMLKAFITAVTKEVDAHNCKVSN